MANFDNRPYIPRPIPLWLTKELGRRKDDIGLNYIKNTQGGQNGSSWDENGNWANYKGPMVPWVKMCSNGTGKNKLGLPLYSNGKNGALEKDGFILYGGNGFEDTFGIKNNQTVLGYDINGIPHTIPMNGSGFAYFSSLSASVDNRISPMYLPSPGIREIEMNMNRQYIREATVHWNCYGFQQLEYMTPYFLNPNITVILEFGWNHFNPESLLDLRKDASHVYKVYDEKSGSFQPYLYNGESPTWTLKNLWEDNTPLYETNVRLSIGMYDVIFGSILHFEFSTEDGIKYNCTTKIGAKNRPYGGVTWDRPNVINTDSEKNKNQDIGMTLGMTFQQFVEKRLKKIKECVIDNKCFFDPLGDEATATDEGTIRLRAKLDSLKKKFYANQIKENEKNKTNNPIIEDRVFLGRNDRSNNSLSIYTPTPTFGAGFGYRPLPPELPNPPTSDDWDYAATDKIWVTMGFLIDLFNLFCTKESDIFLKKDEPFTFFKINAVEQDGTQRKFKIAAHPNLISTNGNVLLIPNAQSPKYNNGVIYKLESKSFDIYDTQTLNVNGDSNIHYNGFMSLSEIYKNVFKDNSSRKNSNIKPEVDRISLSNYLLYKVFGTGKKNLTYDQSALTKTGTARDNLDEILNEYRYKTNSGHRNSYTKGEYSFPQYPSAQVSNQDNIGSNNYGKYGYLNDLFVNVDFIVGLVSETKNTKEFYDKLLEKLSNAVSGFWSLKIVNGHQGLEIMDEKNLSIDDFKVPIFQFDILSSRNIIKGISFSSNVSDAQFVRALAGSSNNQGGNGEANVSNTLQFYDGDRLCETQLDTKGNRVSEKKGNNFLDNVEILKQLQTFGKNDNQFIMTFKQNENKNVVNLTLPDPALLTAILSEPIEAYNEILNSNIQPGFTLELTLQGIAGLNTFQCFSIKNFPKPYSENEVIFQVNEVNHTVTNNNWETKIKAGVRPFTKTPKFTPVYTDGVTYVDSVTNQVKPLPDFYKSR